MIVNGGNDTLDGVEEHDDRWVALARSSWSDFRDDAPSVMHRRFRENGGACRARTDHLNLAKVALYQMS